MNTRHARLSGFTLIELLIVVSIIGVLAGMVSVGAPRIIQMVKRHKARTEMQELEVALARYKQDCGIYPDDSSPESVVGDLTGYMESPDVMHDFSKNPDWRGPYLMNTRLSQHANGQRNQALIDPWH